jgi:hypothetical protein
VRIDTGGPVLTGDAVIPLERDERPASGVEFDAGWWVLAGGLAILVVAAFFLVHRVRRPHPAARPTPTPAPAPVRMTARGRAAVPPPVARGRSRVPGSRPGAPPSAPP